MTVLEVCSFTKDGAAEKDNVRVQLERSVRGGGGQRTAVSWRGSGGELGSCVGDEFMALRPCGLTSGPWASAGRDLCSESIGRLFWTVSA